MKVIKFIIGVVLLVGVVLTVLKAKEENIPIDLPHDLRD